MEQAEAGAGLQDTPGVQDLTNGYTKTPNGPTMENVAFCASPGEIGAIKRRRSSSNRKQRPSTPEGESIGEMLRKGVVDHQLGLSLNLVLLAAMTYMMFPSLREQVGAFFWLQYPTGNAGMWSQGPRDIYLVPGFVVIFTGLRAAFMDYVYLPLAGAAGIRQKKAKLRFAEQTHLLLYYTVYWTWGVALFIQFTPPFSSTTFMGRANELLISIWTSWPQITLTTSMKFYYLTQTAFWVQQLFVINIEERRKDHWQMFTHHIFTIVLLAFSYGHRQLRAGNAILALMDIVDLFFPLAKVFKYLGWQTACDAMFGLFVISWLIARHIGYLAFCWSLYAHVNTNGTMLYGTYSTATGARTSPDGGDRILDHLLQPLLNPAAQTTAWNAPIRWTFMGLLLGLQAITIGWFIMICRVVVKVLQGHPADDSRSDDEGGDEEEEIEASTTTGVPFELDQQSTAGASAEKRFIEVPASSEDLRYSSRPSSGSSGKRKGKGKGGISSGLHLGEHKEILNRIGCLSDEQLARERHLREEKESSPRPGSGKGRRK